jgi:hypothetical protein
MAVTTNTPIEIPPASTDRYRYVDGIAYALKNVPPRTYPEITDERLGKIEMQLAELVAEIMAIRDLLPKKGTE